jgi:hypothetical protein
MVENVFILSYVELSIALLFIVIVKVLFMSLKIRC